MPLKCTGGTGTLSAYLCAVRFKYEKGSGIILIPEPFSCNSATEDAIWQLHSERVQKETQCVVYSAFFPALLSAVPTYSERNARRAPIIRQIAVSNQLNLPVTFAAP